MNSPRGCPRVWFTWQAACLPKRALGYFGCSWHSLTVARRARPKPRLLDTRCNTVSMQHYAAGPQHSTENGGEAWLPGLPFNNLGASQQSSPGPTQQKPPKPAPRACNTHPPPSHRGKATAITHRPLTRPTLLVVRTVGTEEVPCCISLAGKKKKK